MKRYFALGLILSILLTISACGGPAVDPTTIPTTAPVTEPHETEPPATEPPATEPPATEPPATEPPATEPPATEPPATEPPTTEPPTTEPPTTEAILSYEETVLPYEGTWYLSGYSDVYIVLYNIYQSGGWTSLSLDSINYALPLATGGYSPIPPYTAYPYDAFVENPTESYWSNGFQIMCDPHAWKDEFAEHNLELGDNCIYLGGNLFVRNQGSITMYDDTCYWSALGEWYMEGNPDSFISIYSRQDLGAYGDYFGISMWNFNISTLEASGNGEVRGYAARKSTWDYYGISVANGALTIANENGRRVFYRNAVIIPNGDVDLIVGETETLYSTVLPQQNTDQSVTWASSDESVATINGNIVTAVGEGTATLTVKSKVGGHTATCTITVTAPPTTEPPTTEHPSTEPPATEPASNVLIISDSRTISDQTIDTDVYITSAGTVTFNNVTVNGNIYCYGQLKCSGCTANNVYAYAYGSMMSCGAFDGTHGKVSGGLSCNNMVIQDDALDYAFAMWGKF